MLRFFKRRAAIRSYVFKLSGELFRRFDKKRHYTIEQVNRAAEAAKCDAAFMAYAHAMFCTRQDFDGYYGPLKLKCTYDGLRSVVSRRYLSGRSDFDAGSIIMAGRAAEGSFEESGTGFDLT